MQTFSRNVVVSSLKTITARESDSGLDMLALIEVKCLKPIRFKHFDVKFVLDFCRNNIIEGIRRENEPYLSEDDDIAKEHRSPTILAAGFIKVIYLRLYEPRPFILQTRNRNQAKS